MPYELVDDQPDPKAPAGRGYVLVGEDEVPKMLPRQRAVALAGMAPSTIDPVAVAAGLGAGVGRTALGAQYWLGRGLSAMGAQKLGGLLTGDAEAGRSNLDAQLAPYAAEAPRSAAGGKLAGEVAATLPVGGAISKLGGAALPYLPSGLKNVLAPVLEATGSAGMKTSLPRATLGEKTVDMGARMAGGAINGGASAALVDPESAGTGAAIGAVLPPALKTVGTVAKVAGGAVGQMADATGAVFRSDAARGGRELMRALDLTPEQIPQVVALLRGAQTMVPGSTPTLAQTLTTPQAAILQRVVSAGPGGEQLRRALQAQAEARLAALQGVAPIDPNGARSALEDTGNSIARYARAERTQANNAVNGLYNAVDPNLQSRVVMPAGSMERAANTFIGPGAVGKNNMPNQFATEARTLSTPPPQQPSMLLDASGNPFPVPPPQPRGSPWDEVMRMRSSLNEQMTQAADKGDRQALAALTAQKQALDRAIEEQMPPQMLNAWREANASYANMAQRFDTGPQARIFATRNGEPAVQSGEVSRLFWANRPGLAEDVQAFRRLVEDNPSQLAQFRSMITTEGAAKAAQGGELGQRYVDWVANQLPGLREAFPPAQVKVLQNIADDIARASAAAKRGIGPGSNTYQNASNALRDGLLDSPVLQGGLQRLPGGRYLAAAASGMAKGAAEKKAERLAGLLADPSAAASALSTQQLSPLAAGAGAVQRAVQQGLLAPMPWLDESLANLARAGAYRALPLLPASQQ